MDDEYCYDDQFDGLNYELSEIRKLLFEILSIMEANVKEDK